MDTLPRFDAQGYAIPWAADDEIIECGVDDADYGEPSAWPAWTDEGRWEPTDDDFRPADETDVYQPTPEDVAELERWLDRVDAMHDLAEADEREDRRATLEALREGRAVGR